MSAFIPDGIRQRVQQAQAERHANITWAVSVDGLHATLHPPREWRLVQEGADGRGWRLKAGGHATVIESVSREADGKRWHHVSVARRDRDPSWRELREVKEAFIGDRYAYVIFPPEIAYVNLHSHCLHLWSCLDGGPAGQVLPEFSSGTRSI